jgi:hypothetical protein
MDGIALLLLFFYVYVTLSIKLLKYVWRKFSKPVFAIAILIIVVLPFIDGAIGRAYLNRKCEVATRVVLNKTISNIEGIFSDLRAGIYSPIGYGYKFVEEKENNPGMGVRRVTDAGDHKSVVIENNAEKQAHYGIVKEALPGTYWFYIDRYSVRERGYAPEELGSFIWYSYRGGWIERIFMSFVFGGSPSVAECGDYDNLHLKIKELLNATLQPSP